MNINELKIKPRKIRKTIGRGGKRGTYSGRGNKGQKARSGGKINPLFEGGRSSLTERLKKLRGSKPFHQKKINLNLNDLDRNFKNGEEVNIAGLIQAGLVDKIEARRGIKILGTGKITKKLSIDKNILMSKSAEKAIENISK